MNIINDEDIPRAMLEEFRELNKSLKLITRQLGSISMKVGLTPPEPFHGSSEAKQLKRIADFLLHGSSDGLTIFDPRESHIKDLQQETLEIQLRQMREQLDKAKTRNIPKYDTNARAVIIDNAIISLGADSHEERLCSVVLKDLQAMEAEWSWDEVVEIWGEDPNQLDHKIVYRAAVRVNKKVATSTEIKQLFTVTTKTIRVNPSLLE